MRGIIIPLAGVVLLLSVLAHPIRAQEQILVPRGGEKPSFDCAQAKTAAARLICADGELARLDGELGATFQNRKLQLSATDQSKFIADELAWIRDRNGRCGLVGTIDATIEELAASKPCMVSTIRERIAFLAQTGSSSSAGAPLQLLDTSSSQPDQATRAPIIGAGCHKDGDLITIQGVTTAQSLELANGSVKDVWLLVTDGPFCVVESPNGVEAPREISVSRLQIIGQPPPPGATIELTGKLSTGNISQYYAVSTAISVISGRRIAASATPNAGLDSPKFDADQVAALLDKRDPAMSALDEIANTMANFDSKQLTSALNVMVSPNARVGSDADSKLYGTLGNCAASAVKRGSRSTVKMLQNDCAREYLAWFATCIERGETTKACAAMALFMTRVAIEGFEKYCVGATAEDVARFECADNLSAVTNTETRSASDPTSDLSMSKVIGWTVVGFLALALVIGVVKGLSGRLQRPLSTPQIPPPIPQVGLTVPKNYRVGVASHNPEIGSLLIGIISLAISFMIFGGSYRDALLAWLNPPPTLASLPANSSDFATVVRNTGCDSSYSDERKEELFNSYYRNHRMQVSGQIVTLENGSASLRVLPKSILQDISITFADKNVGYNLTKGGWITVSFRMTSAGGCFLPYSGDLGEVIH